MTDQPDDEETASILANHDPGGTELASIIAASVKGSLPAPRGVRARRPTQSKFRPRWNPGDEERRSGAHPDERDPQPLSSALDRLITEQGWTKEVSVRTLLMRWPELVGSTNAEHSVPEAYANRELTVRCESTVWASSLRLIAPQLVAELNRQLGEGTVTRVIVLGPVGPSWKAGPRSVRDGRGPRDTYG